MSFVEKNHGLWERRFGGDVDGYFVQVQVFSEPSSYGILRRKG